MSERKEYIVGLAKGVDFENPNNEMIATTGQGVIPNRTVDVANPRPQKDLHIIIQQKKKQTI